MPQLMLGVREREIGNPSLCAMLCILCIAPRSHNLGSKNHEVRYTHLGGTMNDVPSYCKPRLRLSIYYADQYADHKIKSVWGPPWYQPWTKSQVGISMSPDTGYVIDHPDRLLPKLMTNRR